MQKGNRMGEGAIVAGDVVELKSGSHRMTVIEVREDSNSALCTWEFNAEFKYEELQLAALKKSELRG